MVFGKGQRSMALVGGGLRPFRAETLKISNFELIIIISIIVIEIIILFLY